MNKEKSQLKQKSQSRGSSNYIVKKYIAENKNLKRHPSQVKQNKRLNINNQYLEVSNLEAFERIIREKCYIEDLTINTGKVNTLPINPEDIVPKIYVDQAIINNISGPETSADNGVARFDGTDGKIIQGSTILIDDEGNLKLTSGFIQFTDLVSTPPNGMNGTGRLYTKSGSSGIFWLADSGGVEIDLTSSGGDVSGPASSTDTTLVRYSGITGKLVQESNIILDNSGNISGLQNIITSNGYYQLGEIAAPLNPLDGEGRLYMKTGDDGLFWKPNSAGSEVDLTEITGDVFGPGSTTDNALVRFDLTTGKLIKNSPIIIDDSGNLTGILSITHTGDINTTGNHLLSNGYIQISDIAAPGAPLVGLGRLYKKTGNNGLFWYPNGGSEIDLTTTGGDLFGPGSATNNALARFNLTTGKIIKNSLVQLSDSGDLIGIKNITNSGNINTTGNHLLSNGYIQISDIAAPANPLNGQGRIYKKTGDDGLFWKPNSVGLEVDLTATGGDVFGPGSATDNAIARFDTTTGKLIQNSLVLLDDSGNLTGIAGIINSGNINTTGNHIISSGYIEYGDIAAPGAPLANLGRLYKKAGNIGLFWHPNSGSEVDLTSTGGDVFGPVSSTDNAIALYNGTTGKIIKDSSLIVDGSNNLSGVNNFISSGYIQLSDIAAPPNPLDGEGRLYKKTGDDGIFWKPNSAGPEVDLTATASGGLTVERITVPGTTIVSNTVNTTIIDGNTNTILSLANGTADGFFKNISMEGSATATIENISILNSNGNLNNAVQLTQGEAINMIWSTTGQWNLICTTGFIFSILP